MQILTGASMREADRRTIEDLGIASPVLMESAGRAVVRVMTERIEQLEDRSIAIVCGKGNNGGDGLVVLRTLLLQGYDAKAFVLAPFEELASDALRNLQSALKLGLPVESTPTEESWLDALAQIASASVIVDAVLGTGLSAAPRGLYRRAIADLNALAPETFRVAVDVPSGLSSDSGVVPGEAFEADLTVALAAPKVCHFIPPACEQCGDVEVVEIGIPPLFLAAGEPRLETLELEELAFALPSRSRRSHKGTYGHLLLVAGSVGKTGAGIMAAEAALRSGAGLVTVASAKSAIPMMAPRLPEAMWVPLPETDSGAIALEALAHIERLVRERSALALGPGLGPHDETARLVREIVARCSLPTVVDADGLNALAQAREPMPDGAIVALTPHPGEAGRLLGESSAAVERDRVSSARRLASSFRAHVVLKGYRTLVSDLAGNLKVNVTGNPGMATGGTGDILTGILGGLLAQGIAIDDALGLGVYLHGYAGDLAAAELGETSLIATDLLAKLAHAFRDLEAHRA
jgi:ADP-dependent NAD(P)H-hydrate dehydratase / NAD(P)H-hydrate epimerase